MNKRELKRDWGPTLKQAAPKVKAEKYLGVLNIKFDDYEKLAWQNLVAMCKEFWSFSIRPRKETFGHFVFSANGPSPQDRGMSGGTEIWVSLKGNPLKGLTGGVDLIREWDEATLSDRDNWTPDMTPKEIIFELEKMCQRLANRRI